MDILHIQIQETPTTFDAIPVNGLFCFGLTGDYRTHAHTKVSPRKYRYKPNQVPQSINNLYHMVYPIVIVSGRIVKVS